MKKILPFSFFYLIFLFSFLHGETPNIINIKGLKLFSQNRIRSNLESIPIKRLFIKESEYEEDKYITADIEKAGFEEYNGRKLLKRTDYKKNMYTFRTGFFVDENLHNEHLSLYMPHISYPRNIYINGINIQTFGRYRKHYNTNAYYSYNIYLSKDLLKYGDFLNELAIQIYPEGDSSSFGNIILGSYYQNSGKVFLQNFISLNMVQAAVVVSIIIFLYMIFLFFTIKFKNYIFLYFGLTCLFYALSYSNMSLYSDAVPQVIFETISRCSFPWAVLSLFFFVLEFTNILHKKWFFKLLLAVPALIFTFLTLIQKSMQGVAAIFNITMPCYLFPLLLLSVIILIISIIKKKNKKSLIVLASFFLVLGAAGFDILHAMTQVLPYSYLMQFGFFALVIAIFFLLAYDQAKIYLKSIKSAADLNIKNESLNKMIQNISLVVNNFFETSKKLEDIINIWSNVIKEYEQNNKNIIEKVLERFSGIKDIIKNIGIRIDVSNEKIPVAIMNQTSIIEEISATLTNMNNHMEKTMVSVMNSNDAANGLVTLATKSTEIVKESKFVINNISEYSRFLWDVLSAIEDITDKTNILSINAAIEAARQGTHGKGFSVIAGEISKLSHKSKETLETSFDKIKEVFQIIKKSRNLSDEVSSRLLMILEKISESSEMINNVTNLIQVQKKQSSDILTSVENLLNDTVTIKENSAEEQNENLKVKNTLFEFKNMFTNITKLLKNQMEKGEELHSLMGDVKKITEEYKNNINILKETI